MVTQINLLAWRDRVRTKNNRRFAAQLVFSAAVGFVVILGLSLLASHRLESQLARNDYISSQVEALNLEVTELNNIRQLKQRQLERVAVIRSLQTQRNDLVALFNGLALAVPEGLYLSEVKATDGRLTLRGYASSNDAISTFLRDLESSDVFVDATLSRVDRDQRLGDDGSRFVLQVSATAVIGRIKSEPGDEL
ncbi:MAG: PilN domain-containing protein [Porticoccaceae bacterium]